MNETIEDNLNDFLTDFSKELSYIDNKYDLLTKNINSIDELEEYLDELKIFLSFCDFEDREKIEELITNIEYFLEDVEEIQWWQMQIK